jgi:tRNA dimethylallyltransferase
MFRSPPVRCFGPFRSTATMHNTAVPLKKPPLITVLGATGTGKSELAVSLAKRLNGEVINGDALQLYAGLPITTNKITKEEQQGVPHHLLGNIPLTEPTWTVGQFTREAAKIIDEISSRDRVPILVGGTHYYLQSMLFNDALVVDSPADQDQSEDSRNNNNYVGDKYPEFLNAEEQDKKWPILTAGPEAVLEELRRVDPVMASRWHPKDSRKIRRSLIIYLQTGRRASDIYAEQEQQRQSLKKDPKTENEADFGDDGSKGSFESKTSLRYDSLLFWTYTSIPTLEQRLATRVDKMIERGLLEEIKYLHSFQCSEIERGHAPDLTRGIWVAIGYKQFENYLQALQSSDPSTSHCDEQASILESLKYGKERTTIATRQYAKRQIKWIKYQLYRALSTAGARDRLFVLDSTDISAFKQNVEETAGEIAERFLRGDPLPVASEISNLAQEVLAVQELGSTNEKEAKAIVKCDLCGVTVTTERDWKNHLRSTKHRRAVKRKLQDARNPEREARNKERLNGLACGVGETVEVLGENEDVLDGSGIFEHGLKEEVEVESIPSET